MIGPAIGGALARPCQFYPTIFMPGSIWDKYPYLLPNLFSACAVFLGLFAGIFFLEETHPIKKHEVDHGLIMGQKIVAWFSREKDTTKGNKLWLLEEDQPLIDSDDQLPGYQTTEPSPILTPCKDEANLPDGLRNLERLDLNQSLTIPAPEPSRSSANRIFTKPIILNTLSFGILALYVHRVPLLYCSIYSLTNRTIVTQ